jgi:hypothetical protein
MAVRCARTLNRATAAPIQTHGPPIGRIALVLALLAFAALRVAIVHAPRSTGTSSRCSTTSRCTAQTGELHSAGHPGCRRSRCCRSCATAPTRSRSGRGAARLARAHVGYLAGVFALLAQLLPADRHARTTPRSAPRCSASCPRSSSGRSRCAPIRSRSRSARGARRRCSPRGGGRGSRSPRVAFGVGWLGTQKLAYVAALAGCSPRATSRCARSGARGASSRARPRLRSARARAGRAGAASSSAAFAVPQGHAALAGTSPETVRNYLDVFDFYRATIGYSQYLATLPSLGPHSRCSRR